MKRRPSLDREIQRRRRDATRRQSHDNAGEEASSARQIDIDNQPLDYDAILDLLEYDSIVRDDKSSTLPGLLFQRLVTAVPSKSKDSPEIRESVAYTLISLQGAIDKLASLGYDLLSDKNALSGISKAAKHDFARLVLEPLMVNGPKFSIGQDNQVMANTLRDITEDIIRSPHDLRELTSDSAIASIASLFMSNSSRLEKFAIQSAIGEERDITVSMSATLPTSLESSLDSKGDIFHRAALNPSAARGETQALLRKLCSPSARAFAEQEYSSFELWGEHDDKSGEDPESMTVTPELFAGEEVSFTLLPPGTELREYAEVLYKELSETEKPYFDPQRLDVLERLRDEMGRDRCYYVHGKSRKSKTLQEDGTYIREDYVGLVIQNIDPRGRIIGEDAIAVSPIAKKHAGYLVRHDFGSGEAWRNILSMPKAAAQSHGARPLKFTAVQGQDKYDAWVKKALELLTCPPAQFSQDYELRQRGDGEYKLVCRRQRRVGQQALLAAGMRAWA